MDPVTLAIVAALVGGVFTDASAPPITDAYNGLKRLLKRKFGHTEALVAIESLEKKPDSPGRQGTLAEELKDAGVDKDEEIVRAAHALLDQIKAQPGGEQYVQTVTGNLNAVVQGGGSATVYNYAPPPPESKNPNP
jgi:hypothetical protein